MNTVLIFILNYKIKLSLIRILVECDMPFVEASNIDEALFKLGLIQDISLIIEEYQDGVNSLKLAKTFADKGPNSRTSIIWLIPENRKDLIALASKWQIADLIPLPLSEESLTRKVKAIIQTFNELSQSAKTVTIKPQVLSYHEQKIKDALALAKKGNYPISFVYLQVNEIHEEDNSSLLEDLKSVLRGSDSVMEVDPGQFLILLPFTAKANLPIVESKIKDALQTIIKKEHGRKIHIYGVCFPDDIPSFDELIAKLAGGIEQSMNISKQAVVHDSDLQKKLLKYRNVTKLNRYGFTHKK